MSPHKLSINVDLRHALLSIAKALDFVGIDDLHHGHRVAYSSYKCAIKLGWDEYKCQLAFFTGLVHDCGVSQSTEHLRLVQQLAPQSAEAHCIRGADALNQCQILKQFANAIRFHHTSWQELQKIEISELDKELSALVYIADRLDFFRARYINGLHSDLIVLQEELMADNIREHKGTLFQPEMADAMIELCLTDGFWFGMEADNIEQIALSFNHDKWLDQRLSWQQVTELAHFLAHIVDAKSPFTHQHSEKVAILAKQVAEKCQLDNTTTDMIFIAGLMHDVGKLKTPDEILHKEGKLTRNEYSRIKRHTTDTEITLQSFFPNSIISDWASNHHERLDGSGYPNHLSAENLDLPSRIIAVVDIFQALSQHRPYRGRMSTTEILEIMEPLVAENKIDADVFGILKADLDYFYTLSTDENIC